MRIFCVVLIGCLSFNASAKSSKDCLELKAEQIRLALTGSNLANINSTRTAEGGPYRPFIIKACSNGQCDVSRDKRAPLMKYLPGHPDADKNGYVAYPNIDEKSEYATFNMIASKLKLFASVKACGSKILIDNGNSSFAIRYDDKKKSNVKEDIFNLTNSQQVVSWMRQDSQGRATTINFAPKGQIVSPSQAE